MAHSTTHLNVSSPASQVGDPTWEIAHLFPAQGDWTEEEYLALDTKRLVELSDGVLEVLPMPTILHQLIVKFLCSALDAFLAQGVPGTAFFAPLPVRLAPRTYREPDIVYLRPERIRNVRKQPEGADLVMEVVSEGAESRHRDLEVKRQEYAAAGISEYWIVDPQQQKITVLALAGDAYRTHGEFAATDRASSVPLEGFSVSVSEVFAAGNQQR